MCQYLVVRVVQQAVDKENKVKMSKICHYKMTVDMEDRVTVHEVDKNGRFLRQLGCDEMEDMANTILNAAQDIRLFNEQCEFHCLSTEEMMGRR